MSDRIPLFAAVLCGVASFALADGGVQPLELFDPSRPGAREQIRPNADTGSQLAVEVDGAGITATLLAGPAGYPGFIVIPAGGAAAWNCSLYGHIEAKITNLGDRQELVNLRVDNASSPENRNPWNAEMMRIDAGKTQTIRVYFGYSYYFQKGYPLDPSAVVRLLFFTGKLDHEAKFRIEEVKAAGWQGEKPGENPDQARFKPEDGRVFEGATAGGTGIAAQGTGGATAAAGAEGVAVRLPAGGGTALATIGPARGFWDFSPFMQVRLCMRNDGVAVCAPRFRLTSIDGTSREVSASLEPGVAADVVLPFAPEKPWTAPNDPAQMETLKGGSWDRIPGTGTAYRSQKTRGLEILPDASGVETALTVLSMRAENPPAVRPDWLGTRPPVPGEWKQTLKQEFNGDALDDHLFSVYWFHWWDKRQHNSKNNVFLRDGKLVLRTEKKKGFKNDDPKGGEFPGEIRDRGNETDYATGWVDTFGKWTQRYGYFEFRCKLPTAPCLWPGIWTMPDRGLERNPKGLPQLDWSQFRNRTDTFSGGMEIDIVEAQSSWGPHRFNSAIHCDGYGKEHKKLGTSANYIPTDPDGFITVGMLWLPGSLSFYGNGELFWQWESPRVADEPMYIQFQNQLGGWDNDALDDSLLPADFEIDYIRVWQRADLASSDDGQKPNEGGLDGRIGPGLSGPAKEDPRDERLRETRSLLEQKQPAMKINDFEAMLPPAPTAADGAAPRILKWKDGKKGVFLLAFDDGCNSQLDNAIPLLHKYSAVGTFYIIYGGGHFPTNRKRWEALVGDPCVVFGNHTLKHDGAEDAARLEAGLSGAQEVIRGLDPKAKWPRLISFGQPGGVPWKVSKEEVAEALARHNLVDRPPFWGATIHVKTVPEAEKLVDEAIAQGKMGHLDFHGVGGDWLAPPTEFLEGLLKKLLAERDSIWQTSAIDYHKYKVERDASAIEVVSTDAAKVALRLTSTADSELYDLPLTIEAEVPADWTLCHVAAEGLDEVDAKVVAGRVRFYALPGTITLTKKP